MANTEQMKEHYDKAAQYYEYANKCPHGTSAQAHWQQKGDAEYAKGHEAYQKEAKAIKDEALAKQTECMKKYDEAYSKGDYKAAKESQKQSDKIESESILNEISEIQKMIYGLKQKLNNK